MDERATNADVVTAPEWLAYKQSPQQDTFAALWKRFGGPEGPADDLLYCLNAFAGEDASWRVSQHAAQAFLKRGFATEAHYHAVQAVERSSGHVLAHVSLARALELRRFSLAVLYQLDRVRERMPMLERRAPQREPLRGYIASAFIRNLCYIGDLEGARPWLEFARRSKFIEVDIWMHVLNAAVRTEDAALAYFAAQRIVGHGLPLSGRETGRTLRILREALLRTLRARA